MLGNLLAELYQLWRTQCNTALNQPDATLSIPQYVPPVIFNAERKPEAI